MNDDGPFAFDSFVDLAVDNGSLYALAEQRNASGGFALLRCSTGGTFMSESYFDGASDLEARALGHNPGTGFLEVVASTASETQLFSYGIDTLLKDKLSLDNVAVPGKGSFIDPLGRLCFCAASSSAAQFYQVDLNAETGQVWSLNIGGGLKSGAAMLLPGSSPYVYFAGFADSAETADFTVQELDSFGFSEPSGASGDPAFDFSDYTVSLSSTSQSVSSPNGVVNSGGDSSAVSRDMALIRFGSAE
jgi:hypothetical protein